MGSVISNIYYLKTFKLLNLDNFVTLYFVQSLCFNLNPLKDLQNSLNRFANYVIDVKCGSC